jgi:type I restriction enzyme M protein
VNGQNSWAVSVQDLMKGGCDLSARNPNRKSDIELRPALELVQTIRAKEERILELLGELEEMLEVEHE